MLDIYHTMTSKIVHLLFLWVGGDDISVYEIFRLLSYLFVACSLWNWRKMSDELNCIVYTGVYLDNMIYVYKLCCLLELSRLEEKLEPYNGPNQQSRWNR